MTAKVRHSGIELLRIVAAMGIILIHIGDGRITNVVFPFVNHVTLYLIESFAHCCVNLFILITGYFLINTDKRTVGKPLDLLVQVLLVQTAMFVVYLLTNRLDFSLHNVALYCTPNNYFVVLFIVLYLISPYLNRILRNLSRKEWKCLITITMMIFSFYATAVDFYGEILDKEWFGLSPIGAWGNQQGFNIVQFVLVYIWGAYLKIGNIVDFITKKKAILIFVISLVVCWLWAEINNYTSVQGLRSAWCYHNPFIIIMAVSLFVCFSKFTFSNRIVNSLAKAAFMSYILHTKVIMLFKWDEYLQFNVISMLAIITAVIFLLYAVSWIVYNAYTVLSTPVFRKLNHIELPFFENQGKL